MKIKPIKIGFPAMDGNELMIRTMPTLMGATSSQIYWQLFNSTDTEIPATEEGGEPQIQTNNVKLADGNVDIPEEIYSIWLDDEVIEDYVLGQLKLERL